MCIQPFMPHPSLEIKKHLKDWLLIHVWLGHHATLELLQIRQNTWWNTPFRFFAQEPSVNAEKNELSQFTISLLANLTAEKVHYLL